MKKIEVDYKGNVASLIKNVKINSYEELLSLELRPFELTDYIEVIQLDYDTEENRYRDPLALLIMKIADVNFCKFFISQIVELGYQKELSEVYNALFERSPKHVKEVISYLIASHSPEELRPINEDENVNTYAIDNTHFFKSNNKNSSFWLNFDPETIFDNIKLLSDYLSEDKSIFHAKNLLDIIEQKADTEETEKYIKSLTQYIIKNNYGLDYGVAPHFICLNHLDENITNLYNHLSQNNEDLKDDLMIYLARQFKSQGNENTNMMNIMYHAKEKEELSFFENKAFAQLLFEKKVFSEEIDTSLESLAQSHFDFILQDKKQFNDSYTTHIKPSESVKDYLSTLKNEEKKKFLTSLAKNPQMHEFINTTYCAVLEELLFEQYPRNLNMSYFVSNHQSINDQKELAKDILNHLASLNIGFKERVNEILEVKLQNMNEEMQKNYFEIFMSPISKNSMKIKI